MGILPGERMTKTSSGHWPDSPYYNGLLYRWCYLPPKKLVVEDAKVHLNFVSYPCPISFVKKKV
jgi:hypothetical protein